MPSPAVPLPPTVRLRVEPAHILGTGAVLTILNRVPDRTIATAPMDADPTANALEQGDLATAAPVAGGGGALGQALGAGDMVAMQQHEGVRGLALALVACEQGGQGVQGGEGLQHLLAVSIQFSIYSCCNIIMARFLKCLTRWPLLTKPGCLVLESPSAYSRIALVPSPLLPLPLPQPLASLTLPCPNPSELHYSARQLGLYLTPQGHLRQATNTTVIGQHLGYLSDSILDKQITGVMSKWQHLFICACKVVFLGSLCIIMDVAMLNRFDYRMFRDRYEEVSLGGKLK